MRPPASEKLEIIGLILSVVAVLGVTPPVGE
jgi:hypothetical protein